MALSPAFCLDELRIEEYGGNHSPSYSPSNTTRLSYGFRGSPS